MKNDTNAEKCDSGPCAPTAAAVSQFQKAVQVVVGKWKIEILCILMEGCRRFGELRKSLPGITQHMLTAQLRDLEHCGLVKRTVYAQVPPRVDYEFTPAAQALRPVCEALLGWARDHAADLNLD